MGTIGLNNILHSATKYILILWDQHYSAHFIVPPANNGDNSITMQRNLQCQLLIKHQNTELGLT